MHPRSLTRRERQRSGGWKSVSNQNGGEQVVCDSQVGVRQVVARLNGALESDDLVEADVGVEGSLDLGEDRDRAVGTSTTVDRSENADEGA